MHGRNIETNVDDTTSTAPAGHISYLARPGGRIGYDVAGAGSLIGLEYSQKNS